MNYISLKEIVPRGELGMRSTLTSMRLEGTVYTTKNAYAPIDEAWPGDKEGRIILGETLICRSNGKEPAYLDEIIDMYEKKTNELGYLGPIMPDGEYNEQQLSGHGWLLRGLCEYYIWKKDERIKGYISNVVNNLFMKTKGKFDTYPIDASQRVYAGEECGEIANFIDGWHLSTDIGCAFIPLDGLSQAYELFREEPLGDSLCELLVEMIDRFKEIDLLEICAQTHATMTATRGIIRMYELTGKEEYLQLAQNYFELYINEGMTADYQNYNWFGRPQWTEPCAVIDSFMVAMQLYKNTGETSYVDKAQLIYFNGMGREQRYNGGFGCDSCLGHENGSGDIIKISTVDSYWCCSMRAGEGLARVSQYSYMIDEENRTVCVPLLTPSKAVLKMSDGEVEIVQSTGYPYNGKTVFKILKNTLEHEVTFKIYVPEWVGEIKGNIDDAYFDLSNDIEADNTVELTVMPETKCFGITFDVPFRLTQPEGNNNLKNKIMPMHGNLILGVSFDGREREKDSIDVDFSAVSYFKDGVYFAGDEQLMPLNTVYMIPNDSQLWDNRVKVLFDDDSDI